MVQTRPKPSKAPSPQLSIEWDLTHSPEPKAPKEPKAAPVPRAGGSTPAALGLPIMILGWVAALVIGGVIVRFVAKWTGLLTGDNRHGAGVRQLTAGFDRARRRLAAALLRRDHRGDLVAPARMRLRPRDRAGPVLTVRRVAGEERRDGAEIVGVIADQLADPREAPHVDREPYGRFRER